MVEAGALGAEMVAEVSDCPVVCTFHSSSLPESACYAASFIAKGPPVLVLCNLEVQLSNRRDYAARRESRSAHCVTQASVWLWAYNLLLRSQHVCLAFLLPCACGQVLPLSVACQFVLCACLAGLACGLTPTSSLLVRGTASSVRAHGVWPCSNATK